MVFAFAGQLTGTAVGNRLYAQGGWLWSGAANIAFMAAAILVGLARGPRETSWVGWKGGWDIRRDKEVVVQVGDGDEVEGEVTVVDEEEEKVEERPRSVDLEECRTVGVDNRRNSS